MGAFKIGIITLFLQVMGLRHGFKNLPEHTQQIIGKLGFKSEVFDLEECAEYIV